MKTAILNSEMPEGRSCAPYRVVYFGIGARQGAMRDWRRGFS